MKLLTFYSDSHQELFDIFLESYNKFLKKNCKLIVKKIDQICPSGVHSSKGFQLAMLEKIDCILENININSDELLIFSDCDVQFFGELNFDLAEKDILFQHDYTPFDFSWYPDGKTGITDFQAYCAGFFVCKQNNKVVEFFKAVKKTYLEKIESIIINQDQTVINKLIVEGYDINHGRLDKNLYWTVAFSTQGQVWVGQEIEVPNTILVHHANFTIGIDNKVKLMNMVKDKIQNNI